MTVNYVYLGYGTTDENGIAKLDHDADGEEISHSYTGVGAGEVDVVASLDDSSTISESSLQSEPYSLIDAIFKDSSTQTKWCNQSNYYNVSVDETGRTITKVSNGNYAPSTVANSTTWSERLLIGSEFICEFEIVSISATSIFRVYYNTNQNKQFELTTGRYKIKVTSDKISYWLDDGNETVLGSNLNITNFENVSFVNATLKFNNFHIYTI